MTEQDEFVARERRFWAAAGDPDFYREHFAEDGRCVFGMGILDKPRAVASMDGASGWHEVEMDDVSVIRLGEDARAITYAARARDGDGEPYEANISSVYVRRDGEWLLALHSQAPVTAKKPPLDQEASALDQEASEATRRLGGRWRRRDEAPVDVGDGEERDR